jgi:hypothetical protein
VTIQTDIVRRAFRMLNRIGIGEDLDADEADEALTAFQTMLLTLPCLGLGGPLTNVRISANYTAGEDERISADSALSLTVTLPDTVTDEDTGEDRAPRNGAIVEVTGSSPTIYVYVAYLNSWKQLTGLTLQSENPLGALHHEGLAAMLAVRIAGPNTTIPNSVALMADKGLADIERRFPVEWEVDLDTALLRRTRERTV